VVASFSLYRGNRGMGRWDPDVVWEVGTPKGRSFLYNLSYSDEPEQAEKRLTLHQLLMINEKLLPRFLVM